MPTIESVEMVPYNLPLHSALSWGAGHKMASLEHLLARVRLSDGAVGLGEVNPRPTIYGETPESVMAVLARFLRPTLVGQSVASVADIATVQAGYRLLKNNHSARAGVDMALWDALADSHGVTLGTLLGATRERVRVSYILGRGTAETMLREAQAVYEAGVRMLKVKVGRDVESDLASLGGLREALPDMDFYLDANETLEPATALAALRAYSDMGAWYCEEPLAVELVHERAELRAHSPLNLIGDDSCFTPRDLTRELALDTFDVLNVKPARTGFTTSLAMAAQARRRDKTVMAGSQASSIWGCVHTLLLAATPNVSEPSEGTYWMQVDSDDALPIEAGYVARSDLDEAYKRIKELLLERYFPDT
jgi:L-alanine-DL-glutamate epimerase-like enolase superfamily enzyme